MALVTTAAVVLRTYRYSETSKIVRLATRDLGVQSAIAKGALRPKSRFGAGLELLSEGSAQLYHRQPRAADAGGVRRRAAAPRAGDGPGALRRRGGAGRADGPHGAAGAAAAGLRRPHRRSRRTDRCSRPGR